MSLDDYLMDLTKEKSTKAAGVLTYEYEFVKIDYKDTIEDSILEYLIPLVTEQTELETLNTSTLSEIKNWKEDMIENLKYFDLTAEEAKNIIALTEQYSNHLKMFRFGQDLSYFPYCSCTCYIRWFVFDKGLYCFLITGVD